MRHVGHLPRIKEIFSFAMVGASNVLVFLLNFVN